MALEHGAPAAVITRALARGGVAEFFPARMRQLDPGAAILRREADLDQLLLLRRQLDDPGKGEAMRRVIGHHGSPGRFASIGRPFEDAPADSPLDRAIYRVGAGVDPPQRHQRAKSSANSANVCAGAARTVTVLTTGGTG